MQPPLLPTFVLHKVRRIARFDGWSVLVLSGGFALIAGIGGDKPGAIFGVLIAGAGAIELHGESLLKHGRSAGLRWLPASQAYLLLTVIALCLWQVQHIDIEAFHRMLTDNPADPPFANQLRDQLRQRFEDLKFTGVSVDEIYVSSQRRFYGILALLSLLYQGAMAAFYLRNATVAGRALGPEIEAPR